MTKHASARLSSKVKKKYDTPWKVMLMLDAMEEEVHDEISNKPVNEMKPSLMIMIVRLREQWQVLEGSILNLRRIRIGVGGQRLASGTFWLAGRKEMMTFRRKRLMCY